MGDRSSVGESGEHAGDGASAPGDAMLEWIGDVTAGVNVRAERRSAGGSRAGYAVDVDTADGGSRELWLRVDTGFGPQSHTLYTLRREAAVYRALQDTPMRVARLVAVHPTEEAFLMERLVGDNWFSQVHDPVEQVTLARALMEQLAELHRLDPHELDLPELGPVAGVAEHVRDELDEWERQYRVGGEPDPLTSLAFAWLRRHLPDDGDWPTVLVQGDTGPGNFMFRDGALVAVTDWEMAHWGDLHDDLAWVCVRDLQERFTHLPDRFRDYEHASGSTVDIERLRYFRVLAQLRCAVGTLNGVRARDRRGEIANHLIYHAMHARLLAEALAEAEGVARPTVELRSPVDADDDSSWTFDVALDELRDVVVPALDAGFARQRAKGLARLLKYLREEARLGPAARDAERDDLGRLLGTRFDDLSTARAAACLAINARDVDEREAIECCLRQVARHTELMRPAMGALADRHYSPLDDADTARGPA